MFFESWFNPKPFNSGYLPEVNGHLVYYAEYGFSQGIPVLVFHGGPGGSSKARRAKLFDLKKYRVVMFDQRGCGQSMPLGKIDCNTTADLLDDASRLLEYLKINQKVIVQGCSWGSTLALLWAERHPERVEKLLLSSIFLANDEARRWEQEDSAYFFPEFVEYLNHVSQDNIAPYYNQLIQSDDEAKQLDAINHAGWFERILGSKSPQFANFKEVTPELLASNRIALHYSAHKYFLKSDSIIDGISKIKDIPTVIIHNRLDMVCPYKGAYDLHKAMPDSKLIIVPEFGHSGKLLHRAVAKTFKEILDNKN